MFHSLTINNSNLCEDFPREVVVTRVFVVDNYRQEPCRDAVDSARDPVVDISHACTCRKRLLQVSDCNTRRYYVSGPFVGPGALADST